MCAPRRGAGQSRRQRQRSRGGHPPAPDSPAPTPHPARLAGALLFTAAEEIDYLGARAYVEDTPLEGIAGVLSLELCGIGDAVALWDAGERTPFLDAVTAALESAGLVRDVGHHVVGTHPALRQRPPGVRGGRGARVRLHHGAGGPRGVAPPLRAGARYARAFRSLIRRPPPFHTYHTSGDTLQTLEPAALHRAAAALSAIVAACPPSSGYPASHPASGLTICTSRPFDRRRT